MSLLGFFTVERRNQSKTPKQTSDDASEGGKDINFFLFTQHQNITTSQPVNLKIETKHFLNMTDYAKRPEITVETMVSLPVPYQ